MNIYIGVAAAIVLLGVGFLFGTYTGDDASIEVTPSPEAGEVVDNGIGEAPEFAPATTQTTPKPATAVSGTKAYTNNQLLPLADARYISGQVPLGDGKYTTSAPKKGYVFLCSAQKSSTAPAVGGTWIQGVNWNFVQKIAVSGAVSWPTATFTDTVSGANRTLTSNALPVGHTTGVFPVAKTDPAAVYDMNPNAITAQAISVTVPVTPTFSATPYCVQMGPVGIMTSGVPLYNAFDAALRDAPAREIQDSCDGHPQKAGEYHYHSLSSCFKNASVSRVLGYALDGYPITGPEVIPGQYLTTEDLDMCHGITSDVMVDGQMKTTYHYVMTQDFPYSISCFRGKPVRQAAR